MTTIKLQPGGWDNALRSAKPGAIFHLSVHELKYPAEIRANPPRVRVLGMADGGSHVLCELVDPWPDAPEYWPPWSAPGDKLVARALGSASASPPAPVPAPPAKPPPRKRAAKAAKPPAP